MSRSARLGLAGGLVLFFSLSFAYSTTEASTCWCDPRFGPPYSDPQFCGDEWKVLQGGLLGFTTVFQGSPVPDDLVTLALLPPICDAPSCRFSLTRSGNACTRTPSLATPVMTQLWNQEMKDNMRPFAIQTRMQLARLQEWLAFAQGSGIPQIRNTIRATQIMIGLLTVNLVAVTAAIMDPPNPDYAHVPTLCLYASLDPFGTADGLTQPQADLLNGWARKTQKVSQSLCQMLATHDNLSGAVLAGDVVWQRRLAVAFDLAKAATVAKGLAEIAARPALAAWPTGSLPASCAFDRDAFVLDALDEGVAASRVAAVADLFAADPLCAPASTWPVDWFTAPVLAEATAYYTALLGPPSMADRMCTLGAICSNPTTTTVTTTPKVGKIKSVITVTTTGAFKPTNFVVVSVPGLAPIPNLVLVNGRVALTVAAPAGTYTMTVTFPEQNNAKLRASTVAVTVVVP